VAALQGTFPDCKDSPAKGFKIAVIPDINFSIANNLCLPEINSRAWQSKERAVMSMPEATVNEDNSLVFRKNKVRLGRQFLAVQPIPVSSGEKSFSYYDFWASVLPSNA
jgi:hypothetical protein